MLRPNSNLQQNDISFLSDIFSPGNPAQPMIKRTTYKITEIWRDKILNVINGQKGIPYYVCLAKQNG